METQKGERDKKMDRERGGRKGGECSCWRAVYGIVGLRQFLLEGTGATQGIRQGLEGHKGVRQRLIYSPGATLTELKLKGSSNDLAHKNCLSRGDAAVTCNE